MPRTSIAYVALIGAGLSAAALGLSVLWAYKPWEEPKGTAVVAKAPPAPPAAKAPADPKRPPGSAAPIPAAPQQKAPVPPSPPAAAEPSAANPPVWTPPGAPVPTLPPAATAPPAPEPKVAVAPAVVPRPQKPEAAAPPKQSESRHKPADKPAIQVLRGGPQRYAQVGRPVPPQTEIVVIRGVRSLPNGQGTVQSGAKVLRVLD